MLTAFRNIITVLLVTLSVFTFNVSGNGTMNRQVIPLPMTFQMDETVDQHGTQTVYRSSQYQAQRRVSQKPDFFISIKPLDVHAANRYQWLFTSIQPAGPPHFSSRAPPVQLA